MTDDPDQEATRSEVLVGPGGPEEPTPLRDRWRRQSVRARAVTAAAAAAALTLGGAALAYAATSSGSDGGATPSASGSASPSPGERGPGHPHGWWLGGEGVHGESTVKDRDTGKWVVRVWQRGTVEKVDGDQVTVKSEDGARWTWTVPSDATVLRDGDKGSGAGTLKNGDTVYVSGTRSGDGTRTADHAFAGTWEKPDPGKWRDRMPGPENWRDGFPGHGRGGMPTPSPSESGATT
ncbi:DUF5666 domain-containing protein [Streptomyces justiciae]|uniref:DUF5666 domain-containing protein n=1 Tax=Streptomyces justiciae TaxID=2780140 RepID=UPI0021185B25|nr:DUF5666 domain-containing protein [Streptomyces justiciae]MCW8376536.1 DUF5666 domain-containing protein [Streptomyces justiciae]